MEDIDIDSCLRLKVAVFGLTSAGKSTFCNSLVGKPVLPMGVNATSAWPVSLCPCKTYPEGRLMTNCYEWNTQAGPVTIREMIYHREFLGMPLVSAAATQSQDVCPCTGVLFVDLPGLGVVDDEAYRRMWENAIRTCDFAILVHNISTPLESRELHDMLNMIKVEFEKKMDVYVGPRLFVLCNKADLVATQDLMANLHSLAAKLVNLSEHTPLLTTYIESAADGLIPPSMADPSDPSKIQTVFPLNAAAAFQARALRLGHIDEKDLDRFLTSQLSGHEARQLLRNGTLEQKKAALTQDMLREAEQTSGIEHFEQVFEQLCLDYQAHRLEAMPTLSRLKEYAQTVVLAVSPKPILTLEANQRKRRALTVAIAMTALSLPVIVASGFVLSPLIAIDAVAVATAAGATATATFGAAWGGAGYTFAKSRRLKYMANKAVRAQEAVRSLQRAYRNQPIDSTRHLQKQQQQHMQDLHIPETLPDVFYDYEVFDEDPKKVRYAGGFREISGEEFVYSGPGMLFHPETQCTLVSGHFTDGRLHGPAVIYNPDTGKAMVGAMFHDGQLTDYFPLVPGDLSDYEAVLTKYNCQDTVEDLLYENQRYKPWPWGGWNEANLPADPPAWTSAEGEQLRQDEVVLPGEDWEWVGGWRVVVETDREDPLFRTDPNGWRYAFNFVSDSTAWGAEDGKTRFVRRREWRRTRRRMAHAGDDKSTGGAHPVTLLPSAYNMSTDKMSVDTFGESSDKEPESFDFDWQTPIMRPMETSPSWRGNAPAS